MATGISKAKLVLVRHGQSKYNLENRFTGWKDVALTQLGIKEAHEAGNLLSNYSFICSYTSELCRAQKTLELIMSHNKFPEIEIIKNVALNERDYGDLIGQNKLEAANRFGEEQVHVWRRSFDVPPPNGESLKMTYERTVPYLKDIILPQLNDGGNIIVSAHGNSIRAIIMYLFNYSKKNILKTEIGWCEPWVITFENNIIVDFEILIRPDSTSMSNCPKRPILRKEII